MFKVVVHELGHSLGLDHSRDKNAVMYPYYTGVLSFGSYDLPQDDLEGSGNIFQLYDPQIDVLMSTFRHPEPVRDAFKAYI